MHLTVTGTATPQMTITALGGGGSATTPGRKKILYSVIHRSDGSASRVALKEKKGCGCNEKSTGISHETMERVGECVDQAAGYLHQQNAGASRVRVQFSSRRIVYFDGQRDVPISFDQIQDVAVRTLLSDTSKDVVTLSHSDSGATSNRPANCPHPLEKTTQKWVTSHAISGYDYLKQGKHDELDGILRAEAQPFTPNTASRIKASARLIEEFRLELQNRRNILRNQLGVLLPHQHAELRAKRRQIRHLTEVIDKLPPPGQIGLDRRAIFRNVAYCNPALQGLTPIEQHQRAALSRSHVQAHLMRHKSEIGKPQDTFIQAYADDHGDLLVHDLWDYETGVHSRGGQLKGGSIEEFIVFNTANLLSGNEGQCVTDALESLGLHHEEPVTDDNTYTLFTQALTAARQTVRAEYNAEVTAAPPGETFQAQVARICP